MNIMLTHKSIHADGKVVWTEPIDVPSGFSFGMSLDDGAVFFYDKNSIDYFEIQEPYYVGQVITVICDACSGSGKQTFDLVYDTTIDTVFHRCPICKGKSELKVKVTAISVVNNEFRMEGGLL